MLKNQSSSWAIGILGGAVLTLTIVTTAWPSSPPSEILRNNETHNAWLARSLQEIQTVKVGMTRGQLLKLFTTEGGISNRTMRKYVYRGSPHIKVDVQFERAGASREGREESQDDKIVSISRPYLENPIPG